MLIHEAIAARSADKPYITRRRWSDMGDNFSFPHVKIMPTNSPDCCVVISRDKRATGRGWQPTMDDLIADDWEIAEI